MFTVRQILLLILLFVLFVSCSPEPTVQMMKETNFKTSENKEQRFQVSRVGIFEDELAYNSRRGIYVISDSLSGKQFVGISGLGIAEMGSHTVGKGVVLDER